MMGPLVFQVFLGLTTVLYTVTIVIYFLRRNLFPVAQRMPHLVLCEFFMFAVAAIENLLVGAFPDIFFFSSCKVYMLSAAAFENFPMALLTYRVVWICVKNLVTKKLVFENRKMSVQEKSNIVSRKLHQMIFWLLRNVHPRVIPLLAILPTLTMSLFEVYQIWNFANPDITILDVNCTKVAPYIANLKLAAILPLCVLGMFAFAEMQDHFGLAKEVRSMLVLLFSFMMVLIVAKNPAVYNALMAQSKAFFLLSGGLFIPLQFVIQGLYPVVLSVFNEQQLRIQDGAHRQHRALSSYSSNSGGSEPLMNDHSKTTADHAKDLLEMIHTPHGRDLILLFLQKEMSVENLLFIEDIEGLRSKCAKSPSECMLCSHQQLVQHIVDKFISNSAPNQVNLSQNVQATLLKALDDHAKSQDTETHILPLEDPFEKAYQEVLWVLTSDSYARFRMTKEYENYHIERSRSIELPTINE
jgi:hypothetical protein